MMIWQVFILPALGVLMCEAILYGKYYAGPDLPLVGLPSQHPVYFRGVRFAFLASHKKSLYHRWYFNQRARRNLFTGSLVAYLLGY